MLFEEWGRSLSIFLPKNICVFFSFFWKRFFNAIKVFLLFFGWLLAVDALLFIFAGGYILKASKFLSDLTQASDSVAILLYLLAATNWFVLSVAFFLAIRKGTQDVTWDYFKVGFLRYIELALIFSLFVVIILYLLVGFGISVFPNFHWTLNIFIRLIELLTICYWLDSKYRFRDVLCSLERSLNLLLYNIPLFLLVFVLWFFLKWTISLLVGSFSMTIDLSKALSGVKAIHLLDNSTGAFSLFTAIKLLILKYFMFFLDHFFVGIIYVFYILKKDARYYADGLVNCDNDFDE